MTDTVTRLMQLAGEWADQVGNISDPLNTHEEWELSVRKAKLAKQALHDELVRLFTPLSDEEMWQLWNAQGDDAMDQVSAIAFTRAIEAAHGIGGES